MVAYATVDQLSVRTDLTAGTLSVDQIATYEEILEAISRKIDNFCRRPDGFVASAADVIRYFEGNGKASIRISECTSVTSVAVKDAYTDTTYVDWTSPSDTLAGDGDWYLAAGSISRPIFNRTPYTLLLIDPNGDYAIFTKGYKLVTVKLTAKFGYAVVVPPDIREACLAQAILLIKRYQGAMSSDLASDDLGVLAMKIRQSALSRDVQDLLVQGGWSLPLYGGEL